MGELIAFKPRQPSIETGKPISLLQMYTAAMAARLNQHTQQGVRILQILSRWYTEGKTHGILTEAEAALVWPYLED